jgi:citrate/tricarballylate utilization protein
MPGPERAAAGAAAARASVASAAETLLRRGEHSLTVCNACRYCEQYCPVFPAIERRLAFGEGDLVQLANLCHNCGECLYACQYAPPHEFGIDLPRTLAELRRYSYEQDRWPAPLSRAFRHQGAASAAVLALAFTVVLAAATALLNPAALAPGRTDAAFYSVVPHGVMVGLFSAAGLFVVLAMAVGVVRFWRRVSAADPLPVTARALWEALRDGATLRHLHANGPDCVSDEETRTPWRRWSHHATLGGFALCFASTSVAAVYHSLFGWQAPYGYASLPVVLGTAGGLALLVGPIGQWWERRRRDPALGDPEQHGSDSALLLLLWLTSATGLLLLALRERPVMGALLVVHLGVVLALFVSLPYGKFVHGFYRLAALVRDAAERAAERALTDR